MTKIKSDSNDEFEFAVNPKDGEWNPNGIIISESGSQVVFSRAIKKEDNFIQPGTHASAPGLIIPKTETYQGNEAPQKKTDEFPEIVDWEGGIDGLTDYVASVPKERINHEVQAITKELGVLGSNRSIAGGSSEDYVRRDQLKAALDLFRERVSEEKINPKEVPDLAKYVKNQFVSIFSLAISGAFIRQRGRGKGKSNKNCSC